MARHPWVGERAWFNNYGDHERVTVLKVRGAPSWTCCGQAKVQLDCGRRMWVSLHQLSVLQR